MPKKVLLIDDEQIVGALIKKALAVVGDINIVFEYHGDEAINSVEREQPDLVILDGLLPGTNGEQICINIRKTYPKEDMPIIFLSSFYRDISSQRHLIDVCGANVYIPKPFNPVEVVKTICKLLHIKLVDKEVKVNKTAKQVQNKSDKKPKSLESSNAPPPIKRKSPPVKQQAKSKEASYKSNSSVKVVPQNMKNQESKSPEPMANMNEKTIEDLLDKGFNKFTSDLLKTKGGPDTQTKERLLKEANHLASLAASHGDTTALRISSRFEELGILLSGPSGENLVGKVLSLGEELGVFLNTCRFFRANAEKSAAQPVKENAKQLHILDPSDNLSHSIVSDLDLVKIKIVAHTIPEEITVAARENKIKALLICPPPSPPFNIIEFCQYVKKLAPHSHVALYIKGTESLIDNCVLIIRAWLGKFYLEPISIGTFIEFVWSEDESK